MRRISTVLMDVIIVIEIIQVNNFEVGKYLILIIFWQKQNKKYFILPNTISARELTLTNLSRTIL